jgi:hypothetical protein
MLKYFETSAQMPPKICLKYFETPCPKKKTEKKVFFSLGRVQCSPGIWFFSNTSRFLTVWFFFQILEVTDCPGGEGGWGFQ